MTKDEALKLALEALEELNKLSIGEHAICLPAEIDTAMDAIREALAQPEHEWVRGECVKCGQSIEQPEQEPVIGTKTWFEDGKVVTQHLTAKDIYKEPEPVIDKSAAVRIATSLGWEPKRKPLTDEQILELNFDGEFCVITDDDEQILDFARAIEAAHGIWPENSDCYGPDWTDRDGEYLK